MPHCSLRRPIAWRLPSVPSVCLSVCYAVCQRVCQLVNQATGWHMLTNVKATLYHLQCCHACRIRNIALRSLSIFRSAYLHLSLADCYKHSCMQIDLHTNSAPPLPSPYPALCPTLAPFAFASCLKTVAVKHMCHIWHILPGCLPAVLLVRYLRCQFRVMHSGIKGKLMRINCIYSFKIICQLKKVWCIIYCIFKEYLI